jgi:hypothetical protein
MVAFGQAHRAARFGLRQLDADGGKLWTRLVGGNSDDYIYFAALGADGSLLVSGQTNSAGMDGENSHGGSDGFISKYDASGNPIK